jgi:hypothetical protein
MDRETIEAVVNTLREENPDREAFLEAMRTFADTLDEVDRAVLGDVLLEKEPTAGGFDVLNKRLEEGGWVKRSLGRMAEREREIREREQ